MTDTAVITAAVPCQATAHDTATAYRKRGCICPAARQADRERAAAYDRARTLRSRETKPNAMGRYERAGMPPFHAHPARNCADLASPDLMFADAGPDLREAKKVCDGCPFLDACLEWAVEYGQIWGVWGGTSALERRPEIVRRATTAVPA